MRTSTSASDAGVAGRFVLPRPQTSDAGSGGLKDRRGSGGPGVQREQEALGYALDTLREDASDCLRAWQSQSGTVSAKVRLAYRLDANGVTKAWLPNGAALPFGPRTCMSNAVYEIDWSNIVDHPSEITDDFGVESSDAQ